MGMYEIDILTYVLSTHVLLDNCQQFRQKKFHIGAAVAL